MLNKSNTNAWTKEEKERIKGISYPVNMSQLRLLFPGRNDCAIRHGLYRAGITRRVRSTQERFEDFIQMEPNTGCWLWSAASHKKTGYGYFGIATNRAILAHRASWEIYRGPIPEGMDVLHICDTPACVNPIHLFLGTQLDNIHDCIDKGRFNHRNCGRRKITADKARAIKLDNRPQRIIAAEYGIGDSAVSAIKNGVTWKWI